MTRPRPSCDGEVVDGDDVAEALGETVECDD